MLIPMNKFPDDNSGDASAYLYLNMAEPQQHNTLAADAFAAATALRQSLADDLLQWRLMETRLPRASREVPKYCRSVFTRCEGLLTRFDNLSTHELGQTQELQAFTAKFAALKRDLVGVLAMMSVQCDNAPLLPLRRSRRSLHLHTSRQTLQCIHCLLLQLTAQYFHIRAILHLRPLTCTMWARWCHRRRRRRCQPLQRRSRRLPAGLPRRRGGSARHGTGPTGGGHLARQGEQRGRRRGRSPRAPCGRSTSSSQRAPP
jgi:hypothetical protein